MEPSEEEEDEYYYMSSTYMAVTSSAEALDFLIERDWLAADEDEEIETIRPWSDDYLNILRVIDFKHIVENMVEQIAETKESATDGLRKLFSDPPETTS
jgi:hypothetical protein